jgi:hypothetical protein
MALVGEYCEDYPCCGHTPQNPCARQWYDDPQAVRRHLGCDHEAGYCEDEQYDDNDDEIEDWDPGPEVDDQGGMSEVQDAWLDDWSVYGE